MCGFGGAGENREICRQTFNNKFMDAFLFARNDGMNLPV
jgi:hypothetical protein